MAAVWTYSGEFLTFIGPGIVIYSYSKTNKMHLLSQIIYSCKTLYMFRTVFPSIISSSRLHIQQQTAAATCWKHSTCFGRSFRPSSGAQDCTYSNRQLLLPAENTLHVSDGLSVHHQELKTAHTATNSCCYLLKTLYMFRMVFPSIIRSARLHIQQQTAAATYWKHSACFGRSFRPSSGA
jgi:hypothetical protein